MRYLAEPRRLEGARPDLVEHENLSKDLASRYRFMNSLVEKSLLVVSLVEEC